MLRTASPAESPSAQASPSEKELAEANSRADAAEQRTLEFWIEAVTASSAGAMTVKALQQTFSWRVTRPLRAAKIVYSKSRQAGIRRTAGMVRVRLAQIRQARRRG